MAHIYVSDETKELLDKVSELDSRTGDGEIKYLCKERIAIIESSKKGDNNA